MSSMKGGIRLDCFGGWMIQVSVVIRVEFILQIPIFIVALII